MIKWQGDAVVNIAFLKKAPEIAKSLGSSMQQDDVILRIQNNVVRGKADFDKIVKKLPTGRSIAVLIQRRGRPVFLALRIDK